MFFSHNTKRSGFSSVNRILSSVYDNCIFLRTNSNVKKIRKLVNSVICVTSSNIASRRHIKF